MKSFLKYIVTEAKVSASDDYQKKEKLREGIQNVIVSLVRSKVITSQEDLEKIIKDVDLVMTTLKIIPFEVWTKLAKKN